MSKIMTHVVAGYPNEKDCVKLLEGMDRLGVAAIEVQIPFSDPIADGPTIMQANDVALERGMTTRKSFELIKKANISSDLYLMSYLQKVLAFGPEKFFHEANKAGAQGLIIPDLSFDAPEYEKLESQARKQSLSIVPVISPDMSQNRLKKALKNADELIYLTSMKGITGKQINLTQNLRSIAKQAKKIKAKTKLAVGFGVSSKDDVGAVLEIADIAVVGSSVIRTLDKSGVKGAIRFLEKLA